MGKDDAQYAEDQQDASNVFDTVLEAIGQATEGMSEERMARVTKIAIRQVAEHFGVRLEESEDES
jgi:hypothetical protein